MSDPSSNATVLLSLAGLPASPWKNGGGVTRVIGGGEALGWRLSVAEIERAGPFSHFPSLTRHIALLAGTGVSLCPDDGGPPMELDRPGIVHSFPGALALTARLAKGPVRVLNLMHENRACPASIEGTVHHAAFSGSGSIFIVPVRGIWKIGALAAEPGEILRGGGAVEARGDTQAALAYAVRVPRMPA